MKVIFTHPNGAVTDRGESSHIHMNGHVILLPRYGVWKHTRPDKDECTFVTDNLEVAKHKAEENL